MRPGPRPTRRAAARLRAGPGPGAPTTLTAGAKLARWTGEAGNPAGAWDQLAEPLPIRERVSGPEHPDTVTIRNNLAYWTNRPNWQSGSPMGERRLIRH
jgi:hypothetical protein